MDLTADIPSALKLVDFFEQLSAGIPSALKLVDFFEQLPAANLLSTNARSPLVLYLG
jgi:hypothetical protein